MKKYLLILAVSVMILSCFFGKTLVVASGEEKNVSLNRYYTSITVKNGDSLWSIAETYNKGSGMEIRKYIDEVRKMNHLATDSIKAGDSLVIVYFAEAPNPHIVLHNNLKSE